MIHELVHWGQDLWHNTAFKIGTAIGSTVGISTMVAEGQPTLKTTLLMLSSLILAPLAAGTGAYLSKKYLPKAKEEERRRVVHDAQSEAFRLALEEIRDMRRELSEADARADASDARADAKHEAYQEALKRIVELEVRIHEQQQRQENGSVKAQSEQPSGQPRTDAT